MKAFIAIALSALAITGAQAQSESDAQKAAEAGAAYVVRDQHLTGKVLLDTTFSHVYLQSRAPATAFDLRRVATLVHASAVGDIKEHVSCGKARLDCERRDVTSAIAVGRPTITGDSAQISVATWTSVAAAPNRMFQRIDRLQLVRNGHSWRVTGRVAKGSSIE